MNNLTKAVIGAGVFFAGRYLLKMKRTTANLETQITAKIHSLKLDGLTVRVDAKIKNPTDGSLKIKYPFVKLFYKGSAIGSSQVVDKDIVIPSFGETSIEGVMITVPLLSVVSVALDFIKSLKAGVGIKVTIKVMTIIFTAFSSVPYEFQIEQTLKQ